MASEHDRRLAEYERQVDDLQGQLKGLEEEVVVLRRRLQDAPKRVRTLVEKITMPPSAYGTYLGANDDGTVDIFTAGRKMRVSVHPEVDVDAMVRGQEVALNESLN